MELQNIYLSIIFTLLPDYLLHLFRMVGIMSSPIHEHYRCAPPTRRPQQTSEIESEAKKASPQEEPLVAAMYSLQFVADVVNRVQSALHQCSTSSCQIPTSPAMTSIERALARSNEPSFCYFFIDMHPPQYEAFDACQEADETDLNNVLDKQGASTETYLNKTGNSCKLWRQRSISECSDDSFICFKDEDDRNPMGDDDDDCTAFDDDDQTDFNSSDNTDDCKFNNQEQQDQELTKRVRFNLKPQVHVMHTWDFAYRAARKGAWQEIARDRDRFQQRIKRVATTIDIVLNSKHREKVYRDRFLNAVN